MSTQKKCVLAYSGGLDTSAIVPWLIDRGYEVHALLVDVGQDEDFDAAKTRALSLGAASVTVRDAKPALLESVIPLAIGLGATYEETYRLGTALARPFIAREQVKLANELGCNALAHGATGKGNDQVRFEFGYRTLAPHCEVIAPWKIWDFQGRQDLVDYLRSKGVTEEFEVTKTFSMDENLWHLSVEGGPLERPDQPLDIQAILAAVSDRFGLVDPSIIPPLPDSKPEQVEIEFSKGIPVKLQGVELPLGSMITALNQMFRHADWAWDLVLENRFTGVKSRGLYINPAAKLLHTAIDGLSRSCLNKPAYDTYKDLGRQFADLLYRGEFFSPQLRIVAAGGTEVLSGLNGTVTVSLSPVPHVVQVLAADGLFTEELATFEKSDFTHQHADGFIRLHWLNAIGKPEPLETDHVHAVEEHPSSPSQVPVTAELPDGGLVSSAV